MAATGGSLAGAEEDLELGGCGVMEDFMEDLQRFSEQGDTDSEPIKLVIPRQLKMSKESAYTPQGCLFLGLNWAKAADTAEGRIVTRLKAKWASAYMRRRRSSSSASLWSVEWDEFVAGLGIEFPADLQCFELGFKYVPSRHESKLRNVLATDALFIALFLLLQMGDHLRGEEEFTKLGSDPQFILRIPYFWNDLFLLENQIPWKIVRAVIQDFCSQGPIPYNSEDLARKAVHVALKVRVKKFFRLSDNAFVRLADRQGSIRSSKCVAHLEESLKKSDPNWVPSHLLDYLLEFICLEPYHTGWAKTWSITPTSVHGGHRFSAIRRTHGFQIPQEVKDEVVPPGTTWTRESLIALFQAHRNAPSHLEASAEELEEARAELKVLAGAQAPVNYRGWNTIRLMFGAMDVDPRHVATAVLPYKSTVAGYRVLSGYPHPGAPAHDTRDAVTRITTPTKVEAVAYFLATLVLPFDSRMEKYSLLLSVFIYTQEVLRGALSELSDAELQEAREQRCALILAYFKERGHLMKQLHRELYPSNRGLRFFKFFAPDVYWKDLQVAVKVQVLLEAVAARPPLDPTFAKAVVDALPDVFIKEREAQGWPVVVLVPDHDKRLSRHEEDKWHIDAAKTLAAAGVQLGECKNLQQVDMEFAPKSCLRLPHVTMHESTESLIRNLTAWERIKGANKPTSCRETPLASFIKLMDNLIHTEEDVVVMKNAGVIDHHLGSDEAVANMWSELSLGLHFRPSDRWAGVLWKVNHRRKSKKWRMVAEFKRIYLSRPWSVVALLAATTLLLLTLAQTVIGVMQLRNIWY